MIKAKIDELLKRFRAILPEIFHGFEPPGKILPYLKAPIVVERNAERQIEPMQFSLVPAWSKDPRPKFATHNARIESLESKATWKEPLKRRRCLVPITHFIEPIYQGEYAGKMVSFYQKDLSVLAASAIYDEWRDQKGAVLSSFAIITGTPAKFVEETGHDRQPIFLAESAWEDWLKPEKQSGPDLVKILVENRLDPELCVEVDRSMKPGWEKRIKK